MSNDQRNILPAEHVRPVSRSTLTITILAVLLSSVVLNETVKSLLHHYPGLNNTTYEAFWEQWRRLTILSEPVDTVILGDSSGRHGVDPEILDDVLGGYSLNFCTMGNAAIINPAWQLETYLARYGAPRRVILVAVHDVWKRELLLPLIPRIPLPWGFWEHLRASWPLGRDELRDVFLARYVPIYSQDKTVTELLVHPRRVRDGRLWFSPRGFSPLLRADPENAVSDGASHLRWTVPGGWHISEQSRIGLMAMIAMADEFDFDLYVANSPQLAGMLDDPAFGRYYAKEQQVLGDLVASSPRAHLILSPPAEYPPELMQNSDHIAIGAVADFTRRLAAAVAACEEPQP